MMNNQDLFLADKQFADQWLSRFDGLAGKNSGATRRTQSGADIEIVGMLFPSVPQFYGVDIRDFGMEATGYDEIAAQAQAAMKSKSDTVTIYVDSGGGYVSKIDTALEALSALGAKKNLVAHVDGGCLSAAYWLASCADEIHATKMSQVGSVGAFTTYAVAKEGQTLVVRSAPHKGAGIDGITDEQLAAIQERVDDIGGEFTRHVMMSRPAAPITEVQTGKAWIAQRALSLGLIDSIEAATGAVSAATRKAKAEESAKEKAMSDEIKSQIEALRTQISDVTATQKNTQEILAAFSGDPQFAVAQINAGATIEQARAAYADEMRTQLEAAKKEIEALKATGGTSAAGNQGGPAAPSDAPSNWSEALAFVSKRDNISLSQAGRVCMAEFPALHPVTARQNR